GLGASFPRSAWERRFRRSAARNRTPSGEGRFRSVPRSGPAPVPTQSVGTRRVCRGMKRMNEKGRSSSPGRAAAPVRRPVVRRLAAGHELLALEEVLHDLQDLVVREVPLELVGLAVRRLVRQQAILGIVLVRPLLGELLPQLLLIQRDGLPLLACPDLL